MIKYFLSCLVLLILFSQYSHGAEDESKYSTYFQNASGVYSRDQILEFWGYNDSHGDGNYSDTLRLRFYHPLEFETFRGTLRLDTSYVAAYGPATPTDSAHQYQAGNTMLTFWGNRPDILPKLGANFGGRIIFPFGNHGQWAIGPQISSTYKSVDKNALQMTDFSPLIRYMYGFAAKNNLPQYNPTQPQLVRNLQLFPTFGFQLTPSTQLRLWDENGIIYNSAGGGWFVPLDAMVTQRITKNILFAIGASKQVVKTYNQYDWSIYGKVSFNF